jgi:OOP family OmpA-OmpF porin
MQGTRRALALLSGLAALTVTSSAFAVLSAPYGWYVEANVGGSHLSKVSYPGSSSSTGLAGSANLGYKFMPFLAAELNYSQYEPSKIRNSAGAKAATVKHYSYGIDARGILPLGPSGFEAFAKIGLQRLAAKVTINNQTIAKSLGMPRGNSSTIGPYIGIGAQYYMMPELGFVAQWARAVGNNNTGTEDLYSLGINFIFD